VPFVRSPDSAFKDLADYPWTPNNIEVEGLRLHYIDAGPRDGPVALLMHGMPTWSYLNRHVIAGLLATVLAVGTDHIRSAIREMNR